MARALVYSTVAVFLLLQISNAQNAYAYMKAASEEAKAVTVEALRRNEQGRNLLLVSKDAIFYSYYYECYLRMTETETTGTTVSLTPGADPLHFFKDLNPDNVDDVYLEGRWVSPGDESIRFTGLKFDPSIPKAEVRISFDGRTASLTITDRREGSFYGVLRTTLSDKNIFYQYLPLPRNVTLRVGLSRGMDTGYVYYCTSGRCSEPLRVGGDSE